MALLTRQKLTAPNRAPTAQNRAPKSEPDQKEQSNGSDYIFVGRSGKMLDIKIMYEHLKGMGIEASVHGFRSSFRDYMGNETHFAREPIEECLAHRLGNSTEQAYRRQSALKKRQEIMEAWADYCGSTVISPG
jgi:integrase